MVPALIGTVDRALHDRGGSMSFAAPNSMLNVPIAGARRFAAGSWTLERPRLIAKAADATINDVVLAMYSGVSGFDALPDVPLIAMVPVSLRDEKRDAVGGNSIGTLTLNLATHLADPQAGCPRSRNPWPTARPPCAL